MNKINKRVVSVVLGVFKGKLVWESSEVTYGVMFFGGSSRERYGDRWKGDGEEDRELSDAKSLSTEQGLWTQLDVDGNSPMDKWDYCLLCCFIITQGGEIDVIAYSQNA